MQMHHYKSKIELAKSQSNPKGKGNLASGLSLKSHRQLLIMKEASSKKTQKSKSYLE